MQCNPFALQAVPTGSHNISNPVVERVCEWNVGNHSLLKECPWPETLGAVNYLVRHHKVPGLNFLHKLPTAENAMMVRTPMERRAATLARAGTSCGAN